MSWQKEKQAAKSFIARNRAPRVQIEYDLETYGAQQSINLPFVMGVMADLSGRPEEALAPVAERKFLEIDSDNFDERMKASKPRVAFTVPNTLTGEGKYRCRSHLREHGRFLAGRGGPEGGCPQQSASQRVPNWPI